MRISEAFCKMRLSDHCSSLDMDRAIAVTVDSFVGSQKVSCKRSLARAFAKYVFLCIHFVGPADTDEPQVHPVKACVSESIGREVREGPVQDVEHEGMTAGGYRRGMAAWQDQRVVCRLWQLAFVQCRLWQLGFVQYASNVPPFAIQFVLHGSGQACIVSSSLHLLSFLALISDWCLQAWPCLPRSRSP